MINKTDFLSWHLKCCSEKDNWFMISLLPKNDAMNVFEFYLWLKKYLFFNFFFFILKILLWT